MSTLLTQVDIRNFLEKLAAVIELDQIRADALPREKLHPDYCPDMWRNWRRGHLDYIDQLLLTVDSIPAALLQELTQLAVTSKPEMVRNVLLDLFCEAAIEFSPEEESATRFFGWVIQHLRAWPDAGENSARSQLMRWLTVSDPLRIAQDPECGYGAQLPDCRH